MTDRVNDLGATPSTRLDSLAGWGRTARAGRRASSPSSGPSFESLVAEAALRQASTLPSDLGGPGRVGAATTGRPVGALGVSTPTPASLGLSTTGIPGLEQATGAATTGAVTRATPAATFSAGGRNGLTAGEAVVEAAKEHLGVPYLWGGTDPHNGFDCSGLVQDAYRAIGVEMPKWSRHQAEMGVEIDGIEDALPGDVLAFGDPVDHVALYVGDNRMLHAPRTGEVVKIEEIDRPIASIRRIVDPGPAGAAASVPTTRVDRAELSDRELQYWPLFEAAGNRWDVDPALLAAVAKTESAFNPEAVSPVGAQGLMQFMPATAAEMDVDPWDPASAIDGAARYLRRSLDQFGSAELAIASYNAGRGAVSRYGGIPPFNETQNYVTKVLESWRSRS